ncbi:hypothetical protein AN217_26670 [Streptomyces qinglanensis]|uniref:Uncharacterized protein n=1 Tax=Streptomyces qinglanensis TaxID=943816 RepID=A0A1E7KA47_9ACTN|nr:hypothetical protein [Streptomyces qinglanensis]OEV00791.1 hypothetical protein AN217_26670 [Streptomyces qinglanensis]OEV28563.1 hypothetical protein AN220_01135 [Streptomyces nanshensis]
MTYPAGDPNFSGAKMPAFDTLVSRHERAAFLLEQLAGDLWRELTQMRIDTTPALRIRTLAQSVRSQTTELQTRRTRVHDMQRTGGGARLCTVEGIFWRLPEEAVPTPVPGQPPPTDPVALSIELWDANLLPRTGRLRPDGTPFSPKEDAVLSWLAAHRESIVAEARKWNISPQAVAAAISWEAMENVKGIPADMLAGTGIGSAVKNASFGPGKVHVDFPLVNQVEERGYLPRRAVWEREKILRSDEGSIRYIAAIMGAYAKVTEDSGNGHYDIRYDVPMLTQLYQGSDLKQWEAALEKRKARNDWGKLDPQNPMAL